MSEEQIVVQLNPDVPPTGSDLGIVNAARKSFGRRSEWEYDTNVDPYGDGSVEYKLKDKDKRLLEFLARGMTADDFDSLVWHFRNLDLDSERGDLLDDSIVEKLWQWRNTPTHDTPFNHGFFSFEVKAPIFVARQLVKHEYLIMSEYSRRYITDDIEFYTPTVWRGKAEDVKQGSAGEVEGVWDLQIPTGATVVDEYDQSIDEVTTCTMNFMEAQAGFYGELLKAGVAPEQARMVLPQSLMTSWTWSGTLGAFAKMCQLRLAKDSQYETRLVAKEVYKHLCNQLPVAAPLLVEGVR